MSVHGKWESYRQFPILISTITDPINDILHSEAGSVKIKSGHLDPATIEDLLDSTTYRAAVHISGYRTKPPHKNF